MDSESSLTTVSITPKRIKRCTTYAMTWSPVEKTFVDYQEALNYYLPTLKTLVQCCKTVAIYPELRLSGAIHFHLEVQVTNRYKFYQKTIPQMKLEGFINVNSDVDAGWFIYMNKDKKLMEKLLGRELPLTIDDLKVQMVPIQTPRSETHTVIRRLIMETPNLCSECKPKLLVEFE